MNWEAVGAIGEVLGSITVVATLFYLSRQIRQNAHALDRSNEYARANSIHQTNLHSSQVDAQLAQDADLASIYHRALAGEPLDNTEIVRFQAFVSMYFTWLEDLYWQTRAQMGFHHDDHGADALVDEIRPYWRRLLESNAGREWWETDAPPQFSTDFAAAVNRSLRESTAGRPAVQADEPAVE
jgi:hypothetical protein